ncbi:MAG: tRNA pseudouridine(38-40) synthase TruA [Planctomycetes bacterium]|nr:tRNA pseudouridine(38-40) synthase TruA [Planctomycetota bacterium]
MPEDLGPVDAPSVARALRLTVEYSGTRFAGWQVQPQVRTVQGELERALEVVLREQVRVTGASRTDAGVHALGQVVSLETRAATPLPRLLAGLNALLPDDVAVLDVAEAPPGFSARFAARGKHYRYRILDRRTRSPTEAATAWHVPGPLDLAAMEAAAARLVGRHDFAGLASKGADEGRPTVRTIHAITLSRQVVAPWGAPWGGDAAARPIVAIDVTGDGFLYKMVRTIAGTLVQVGKGRRAPESVDAILATRDRRQAGPAAPARGLFLMRVFYEDASLGTLGAHASWTSRQPNEPASSEGVPREGDDHRSQHERPRHDPHVRGGEGGEARPLLRSAARGRDRVLQRR